MKSFFWQKKQFQFAVTGGVVFLIFIWVAASIDRTIPDISFENDIRYIGKNQKIVFTVEDKKSGIRSISVSLKQDDYEYEIFKLQCSKKEAKKKEVIFSIKPRTLKFKEGKAILAIKASDYSFRNNEFLVTKEVIIDTSSPQIELKSSNHYIATGGTCLVVYNVSRDTLKSGVSVGDHFFQGYSISSGDFFVVYFTIPWNSSGTIPVTLEAKDKAGNLRRVALPRLILKKAFRTDKLNISDSFLGEKMIEFSESDEISSHDPLKVYLFANRQIRKENHRIVREVCSHSHPERLWEGVFLRMRGAAKSFFGDQRIYYYNGKEIDRQVHLGFDIASVKRAPVKATNAGVVVFAEYLGIYGNTVIIDHGQGIFSMYSHLSDFKVDSGKEVKKGKVIGRTGISGMAGGDHLHFSIIVQGEFANPEEWWDRRWIENNITGKLRAVLK